MVRGLVQQQHVGLAHERTRKRHPPDLATGQGTRAPGRVHPQLLEHDLRPVPCPLTPLARRQPRQHDVGQGDVRRQHGLLRQVGHGRARLDETFALVELDEARQHAQQG